jgi:hypothetical protein
MGFGTGIVLRYRDPRFYRKSSLLKRVSIEVDDMNEFSPPLQVEANCSTKFQYVEFKEMYNCHGCAAYSDVDESVRISIVFFQASHFFKHGGRGIRVRIVGNPDKDYFIKVFFGNERGQETEMLYIAPGDFSEKTISDLPHWDGGDNHGRVIIEVAWAGSVDDVPVNRHCFVTAHNAFANPDDGYVYCQQDRSITKQLRSGIRGFDLDVYYVDDQVVLAHELSPASGGALTKYIEKWTLGGKLKTLREQLLEVAAFLGGEGRSDVVWIFLESYVTSQQLETVLFDSEIRPYLYGLDSSGKWVKDALTNNPSYPGFGFKGNAAHDTNATFGEVKGKMVVFTNKRNNGAPSFCDYAVRTVYGDASLDSDLSKAMALDKECGSIVPSSRAFFLICNAPTYEPLEAARAIALKGAVALAVVCAVAGILESIFPPSLLAVLGGVALSHALAAFLDWQIREKYKRINSFEKLKAKCDWGAQDGDISQGHYGHRVNFLGVDFALDGDALEVAHYVDTSEIKEFLLHSDRLSRKSYPLGCLGLNVSSLSRCYISDPIKGGVIKELKFESGILRFEKPCEQHISGKLPIVAQISSTELIEVGYYELRPYESGALWDVVIAYKAFPIGVYGHLGERKVASLKQLDGAYSKSLNINSIGNIELRDSDFPAKSSQSAAFEVALEFEGGDVVSVCTGSGFSSMMLNVSTSNFAKAVAETQSRSTSMKDYARREVSETLSLSSCGFAVPENYDGFSGLAGVKNFTDFRRSLGDASDSGCRDKAQAFIPYPFPWLWSSPENPSVSSFDEIYITSNESDSAIEHCPFNCLGFNMPLGLVDGQYRIMSRKSKGGSSLMGSVVVFKGNIERLDFDMRSIATSIKPS